MSHRKNLLFHAPSKLSRSPPASTCYLLHFFLLASSSLEQDQPAQTDRIPKHLQWRDGRSESQHRTGDEEDIFQHTGKGEDEA